MLTNDWLARWLADFCADRGEGDPQGIDPDLEAVVAQAREANEFRERLAGLTTPDPNAGPRQDFGVLAQQESEHDEVERLRARVAELEAQRDRAVAESAALRDELVRAALAGKIDQLGPVSQAVSIILAHEAERPLLLAAKALADDIGCDKHRECPSCGALNGLLHVSGCKCVAYRAAQDAAKPKWVWRRPMPRKLTPADVKALAATPEGLRRLDAAVARALRWVPPRHPHKRAACSDYYWMRPQPNDTDEWPGPAAPPYVSHADDDPDRWRWRGEMIEALRCEFANAPVILTFWPSGRVSVGVGSPRFVAATEPCVGGEHDGCVRAENSGIALAMALAAGGMLEEAEE